jgi:hypothetical protein
VFFFIPIEKYKSDGFKKFLGHVLPIVDDDSDSPGHRNTWASQILFCGLLAAQAAISYVSCRVSFLLPGPNPNFFWSSNVF